MLRSESRASRLPPSQWSTSPRKFEFQLDQLCQQAAEMRGEHERYLVSVRDHRCSAQCGKGEGGCRARDSPQAARQHVSAIGDGKIVSEAIVTVSAVKGLVTEHP